MPERGFPTIKMVLLRGFVKVLKKNNLSIIWPNAAEIRNNRIIMAVIIGENQAPKVVPIVIYAVKVRLKTDIFIKLVKCFL